MSAPIAPVGSLGGADLVRASEWTAPVARTGSGAFARMLLEGVERVDDQLAATDAKITAFAVDDTIPPHEVMFALEQARQSLELVLQVRSHLVEGFQEVMRMQL